MRNSQRGTSFFGQTALSRLSSFRSPTKMDPEKEEVDVDERLRLLVKVVKGESLDRMDPYGESDVYAKVFFDGEVIGETPVIKVCEVSQFFLFYIFGYTQRHSHAPFVHSCSLSPLSPFHNYSHQHQYQYQHQHQHQ
jgi:hypothetical protein